MAADTVLTGNEAADLEIVKLTAQAASGDYREVRQYLLRTQREQDWSDRCYLLNVLAPILRLGHIQAAAEAEPDADDLSLLSGVASFHWVWKCRGGKLAELTSPEQFDAAGQPIKPMMDALMRAYTLAPNDPTPRIFALNGLVVFTEYHDYVKSEYAEAIRVAPDCMPAHVKMVGVQSRKWGGSCARSLQIARAALRSGKLGSDLPACLFRAHYLVWEYKRKFEKDKPEADRYVSDPSVTAELNAALSRWLDGGYKPRRSSLPYLHQAAVWYYLSGDTARLRQLLTVTGRVPDCGVWEHLGDPVRVFTNALQKAAAPAAKNRCPGVD